MMAMGGLILNKSRTCDVTLTLLITFVSLTFGRALYLGDPMAIPIHQLSRGAFILFAFYMISDPKTNPDSRGGRILFGITVALLAFYIRFGLFIPNAPIWALVICFPFVPLIDKLLPGSKFQWSSSFAPPGVSEKKIKGEKNEKPSVHISNGISIQPGRV